MLIAILVSSGVALIYISLLNNNIKQLFMCLLAVHIYLPSLVSILLLMFNSVACLTTF